MCNLPLNLFLLAIDFDLYLLLSVYLVKCFENAPD